jgi:hypothetical protein
MNRLRLMFSVLVLPLALAVSLSTPALAGENVEVTMSLQGTVLDTNPESPVFGTTSVAKGHVSIIDVDLPAGTATIVGLQVEFDVVLPGASTKIHYTAHFDNTTAITVTGDPNNPDTTLLVVANLTAGRVHRSGDGSPDTVVQFASFTYSAGPTVGYEVFFVFTSPDGNDLIQVDLLGPV